MKAGVELDTLLGALDAVQLLGPSCSIYRRFPQTLFKGEFLPSRFFLKLAHKDYRLAAELAVRRVHHNATRLCGRTQHSIQVHSDYSAQYRTLHRA